MGTCETSHRAELYRISHRLLSDASPSRQHAERGVNPPPFDSEVLAVLVDPGAEARSAEPKGHYNYTANRVIFGTLQIFCETALVQN
jgi:hypothetical protein